MPHKKAKSSYHAAAGCRMCTASIAFRPACNSPSSRHFTRTPLLCGRFHYSHSAMNLQEPARKIYFLSAFFCPEWYNSHVAPDAVIRLRRSLFPNRRASGNKRCGRLLWKKRKNAPQERKFVRCKAFESRAAGKEGVQDEIFRNHLPPSGYGRGVCKL